MFADGGCVPACTSDSCSGHGACDASSGIPVCTCTGGYSGATCATCATGTQDNDGNGVCSPVCTATFCSGHGPCSDATGTARCSCTGGYTGDDCAACANGEQDRDHDGTCAPTCAATLCSGHGTCSDASGAARCTCVGGYAGTNCAACPSGMQDDDHDGICAPACTATSCSGHGTCLDTSGAPLCSCSGSYTGSDCSSCPAGQQDRDHDGTCRDACTRTTCGTRGVCDDASGSASCACAGGYTGARCDACAAGTQDNDDDGVCTAVCAAGGCSGHGTCSDANGTAHCVCAIGFTGDDCSACGAGTQDRDHDGVCSPACTVAACSGHGACSDASGHVACACSSGYAGASCSACARGFQDDDHDGTCAPACTATTCSGHGACGMSGGAPECTCTGNYVGAACATCDTGLQDHDGNGICTAACTVAACSGHGACSDDSGTATCACDPGHGGSDCSGCGPGTQDHDGNGVCSPACAAGTCTGHGACSDASGTAVCACSGRYTGGSCAVCDTGLQDYDHDGACTAACSATTCSGHGVCADTTGTATCTCTGNHAGTTCSACATLYQDNDADGTCTQSCAAATCSGHGACSDSSGAIVCTCTGNYVGLRCTACGPGLQDNDDDGVCTASCTAGTCSGHGVCSDATGTAACACTSGFGGTNCGGCSTGLQDNDRDGVCTTACSASVCNGHGACTDSTGTATCTCTGGYTGARCASCVAGTQDNDNDGACSAACVLGTCSGHGACSDATGAAVCTCTDGHGGTSCATCATGYQDKDGDGICRLACTGTTCSIYGSCSDRSGLAVCYCRIPHGGADCSGCAGGFQDNDHNGSCNFACGPGRCGVEGACDDSGGAIQCTCPAGYASGNTNCAGCSTGDPSPCPQCATGYQDNDHNGTCRPGCVATVCPTGRTCSDVSGTATCS